jgi:hypothetical protein
MTFSLEGRTMNAESSKPRHPTDRDLGPTSLVAVALLLGLTFACDSPPPAGPTGGAETTVVTGTSLGGGGVQGRTQGYVLDTAFEPLAGVRVEVLDGPTAGESATTGADGLFWLPSLVPLNSDITFRATSSGYVTDVETFKSYPTVFGASFNSGFYLARTEPPAVFVPGAYSLTMDLPCAGVPADLRTQTFRATVTALPNSSWPVPPYLAGHRWPSGTGFGVILDSDEFSSSTDNDRFVLGVAGPKHGVGDVDLWWQVAPFKYFEALILHQAVVPQRASALSFPVYWVGYCELNSAWIGSHCSTTPATQVVAKGECLGGKLTLAPQ